MPTTRRMARKELDRSVLGSPPGWSGAPGCGSWPQPGASSTPAPGSSVSMRQPPPPPPSRCAVHPEASTKPTYEPLQTKMIRLARCARHGHGRLLLSSPEYHPPWPIPNRHCNHHLLPRHFRFPRGSPSIDPLMRDQETARCVRSPPVPFHTVCVSWPSPRFRGVFSAAVQAVPAVRSQAQIYS